MDNATTRTYFTTLVLDWRTGNFKSYKKRPKNFKAHEIPIDFSLKVQLPKQIELKAHGEVTLSEAKVAEIVAEEI